MIKLQSLKCDDISGRSAMILQPTGGCAMINLR